MDILRVGRFGHTLSTHLGPVPCTNGRSPASPTSPLDILELERGFHGGVGDVEGLFRHPISLTHLGRSRKSPLCTNRWVDKEQRVWRPRQKLGTSYPFVHNLQLAYHTMDEKVQSQHHEAVADPYAGFSPEDAEHLRQYEGKAGKKVVRKVCQWLYRRTRRHLTDCFTTQIDFRLIPVMSVLYLLSHIDRGNVGNAKIEGMDKDLGLVGNQYNIISTIFFVPYIIFGTCKSYADIDRSFADNKEKSLPMPSSRRSALACG